MRRSGAAFLKRFSKNRGMRSILLWDRKSRLISKYMFSGRTICVKIKDNLKECYRRGNCNFHAESARRLKPQRHPSFCISGDGKQCLKVQVCRLGRP